jgi:hypothetical protein
MPTARIGKPIPALPDDAYMASGHYGQSITIIPSWDIVIARFANDGPKNRFDHAEFGRRLAEAKVDVPSRRNLRVSEKPKAGQR